MTYNKYSCLKRNVWGHRKQRSDQSKTKIQQKKKKILALCLRHLGLVMESYGLQAAQVSLTFLLCCLQLPSILSQASYIQCLHLSSVNVPFTACISSILRSPYTLYSQLHIPASKGVFFQELRLYHMLPEPSSPLDSWTHQSCIFFFSFQIRCPVTSRVKFSSLGCSLVPLYYLSNSLRMTSRLTLAKYFF